MEKNKRIIVEPYPNVRLGDVSFDENGIVPYNNNQLQATLNSNDFHNVVARYETGQTFLLRQNIIRDCDNVKYIATSPNPIHLYIDEALDNFYSSERIKKLSFKNCAKKSNKKFAEDVHFLDNDVDNTHHCYDNFLKLRLTSIGLLLTAVEGFMNYIIPVDYKHEGDSTRNLEFIQLKWQFDQKVDILVPIFVNYPDYWNVHKDERDKIKMLYKLRNDITHLKKSSDEYLTYTEVIKNILNIDLEEYLYSIIYVLNDIYDIINGKDFVRAGNKPYNKEVDKDKIDFHFIEMYLKIKNEKIFKYFKTTHTKTKKWEKEGIPDIMKNLFLQQEGDNIEFFISNFMERYYVY